jgi:ATP-binding cassette, subfamily B, multidrug efflux pump
LGTTGSGKSSLAQLLARFYDPSSGDILLDGVSLKDWDIKHVRQSLAYVPQDVFLFSTTIAENISFGQDGMSMNK